MQVGLAEEERKKAKEELHKIIDYHFPGLEVLRAKAAKGFGAVTFSFLLIIIISFYFLIRCNRCVADLSLFFKGIFYGECIFRLVIDVCRLGSSESLGRTKP